tara:strand:+ start:2032 stop:3165 length:1134 start_codon:yes stop_codon:yes gene_type:complete
MQAHFEEIKMKLTKLTPIALAIMLMIGVTNFSLASTHDDDNPNTFKYDRCMYNSASEIVAQTIPSVVYIFMERMLDSGSDEFGGLMPSLPQPSNGVGTGFFINDEGYIVTNAHVVKDSSSLKIFYWESPLEYGEAEIIGIDEIADIAVIKIDPEGPTKFVKWANSEQLQMGDDVIAIGHGLSMPWAVTKGIISYTDRQPDKSKPMITYNQSDTVINQGNSGGPLFNMCGEVVGVNTLLFSRTGSFAGVGFSVPSNLAKRSVDQIIEKGYVTYPAIGIQMKAVETLEERKELLALGIESVIKIENTPEAGAAYEAGLQKDDVIVSVGNENVISSLDIIKQLWYNDIGDILKVKVYRDGEFMTFDVKLKEFQFANLKGK